MAILNRLIPICAALLLAAAGPVAATGSVTLIEALREGGYVIYMRHADTVGEPRDRTRDLTNRALQRNLSDQGRLQAVAIGQAIARLDLAVGHVATSPVFRARDTAELAFGAPAVTIDPTLTADDYVTGNYLPYIEALRQALSTPPEVGNTWLVGHVIPLRLAVGPPISLTTFGEGAAAVFQPDTNGDGYTLIGILPRGWEND